MRSFLKRYFWWVTGYGATWTLIAFFVGACGTAAAVDGLLNIYERDLKVAEARLDTARAYEARATAKSVIRKFIENTRQLVVHSEERELMLMDHEARILNIELNGQKLYIYLPGQVKGAPQAPQEAISSPPEGSSKGGK